MYQFVHCLNQQRSVTCYLECVINKMHLVYYRVVVSHFLLLVQKVLPPQYSKHFHDWVLVDLSARVIAIQGLRMLELGCGCSTVVEHMPRNLEVVDTNPARY